MQGVDATVLVLGDVARLAINGGCAVLDSASTCHSRTRTEGGQARILARRNVRCTNPDGRVKRQDMSEEQGGLPMSLSAVRLQADEAGARNNQRNGWL